MVQGIQTIVIAGAGLMGASIAQLFADGGYQVILYDIKEQENKEKIEGISYTCNIECFKRADFVVEAIIEDLKIKHQFWQEVSLLVPVTAILTSNTSGLSLTKIAEAVLAPERFCGMHWLNPPHICPLIEIIKGKKTDDKTVDAIYQLAKDIHHFPVKLKKEVPGFLVNRFQFAVLREAMSLVEAGVADKEDIDDVFKYGLGLRYACLGPFEIADLGGLDTFCRIAEYLFRDISDQKEVHELLKDTAANGFYGVKSGRGFYSYENGRDLQVISKRDRDFEKMLQLRREMDRQVSALCPVSQL